MRATHRATSVRLLLAAWQILLTAAATLCHAHPAQAAPGTVVLAPCDCAPSEGPHRHLFLLGLELGTVPEAPAAPDAGPGWTAGLGERAATSSATADNAPDQPAAPAPLPACVSVIRPVRVTHPARRAFPSNPVAAHARTGVLLT
jgi:hypothetical protein